MLQGIQYSLLFLILLALQFTNADYYVSNSIGTGGVDGTDPNLPTSDLQSTLTKAKSGDKIFLCDGDIFSGKYILRTDNVALQRYTCDPKKTNPPVLTQAKRVREGIQATLNGKSVIQYDISSVIQAGETVHAFWYNGYRYIPARYPNLVNPLERTGSRASEFIFFDRGRYPTATDVKFFAKSRFADPKLKNLSSSYWVGATLRHRESNWGYGASIITSVVNGEFTFNVPIKFHSSIGAFFLENKFQELDQEGEFFFDPATNIVSLIEIKQPFQALSPDSTDVGAYVLTAPPEQYTNDYSATPSLAKATTSLNAAMSSSGIERSVNLMSSAATSVNAAITIRGSGIQISGINFKKSFTGIYLAKASNSLTSIQKFKIGDCIKFGVYNAYENLNMKNGLIHDVEINGIQSPITYGWSYFDNIYYYNISLLVGYSWQGAGIWAKRCSITNSVFKNMGYAGPYPDGDNLVSRCSVLKSSLTLADVGGIYFKGPSTPQWGSSTGRNITLADNYVSDVLCNFLSSANVNGACYGIYQDQFSSNLTALRNTIDMSAQKNGGCMKLYLTKNNILQNTCINGKSIVLAEDGMPNNQSVINDNRFTWTKNDLIKYSLQISINDATKATIVGLPVSSGKGNIFDCPSNRDLKYSAFGGSYHLNPLPSSQKTNYDLCTVKNVPAASVKTGPILKESDVGVSNLSLILSNAPEGSGSVNTTSFTGSTTAVSQKTTTATIMKPSSVPTLASMSCSDCYPYKKCPSITGQVDPNSECCYCDTGSALADAQCQQAQVAAGKSLILKPLSNSNGSISQCPCYPYIECPSAGYSGSDVYYYAFCYCETEVCKERQASFGFSIRPPRIK